jgi:hypothetical protein
MRKQGIAIAMIALFLGVGAGIWIVRETSPRRAAAYAERVHRTLPENTAAAENPVAHERPPVSGDASAPPAPPRVAPGSPAEPIATPARSTAAHTSPSSSSAGSSASAPRTGALAPGVPALTEPGPTTQAAARGAQIPPPSDRPVRQPVPNPAPPPVPNEAQANDSEKKEEEAAPVPADDPESDRHPPVLVSLHFDPPEIRDGSVATLLIGVTDDLSGVKLVFGTLRSPNETAIVPFSAQDEAGSGVFTARIAIPRQAETGDWFVGNLQITDKANNPLNLVYAKATVPPGGSLRVTSDDSDSVAPDVHRVSVDKGAVGAGEKIQIVVEVDDDRSGVASVTGTFQSPSKAAYVPFVCRESGGSTWVGDISIPASAACGEWTLNQLRVADKANNTAYLTGGAPQLGNVGFVVSGGGDCDSEPPVIDTLFFSPARVSNAAASEMTLSFSIHDDGSGVGSLSGRIEGPVSANGQVPKIFFAWASDPRNPDAPMTARISVPQFAARGTWSVALVQVMDKARNTRTYNKGDPALVNASFMVE